MLIAGFQKVKLKCWRWIQKGKEWKFVRIEHFRQVTHFPWSCHTWMRFILNLYFICCSFYFLVHQVGYTLRKITRHIDFPLVLDIAPFCSSGCKVSRKATENNICVSCNPSDHAKKSVYFLYQLIAWFWWHHFCVHTKVQWFSAPITWCCIAQQL